MKALVFGADGQVGAELVRLLGPDSAVPHRDADITSPSAVDEVVARHRPEVVFNCAAYNAVDKAETDGGAYSVNALGPLHLAQACRASGAALVHFSTNFVFDGSSDEPYIEADEPAPLSRYGQSKLDGEKNVMLPGLHVLVIRTAAVYGGARGFPHRIVERASRGEALRVVSDQSVNPTYARDLAAVAKRLAERQVDGIVHATNTGCCTWYEFACAVLEEAGIDAPVKPVSTGDYPAAARRPKNGCLASSRIPPLRPWREALHEALNP